MRILLVLILVGVLEGIFAARRVRVEDLVANVKLRFSDEFKKRTDDGDPPGLESLLDLPKDEDLAKVASMITTKLVKKVKFEQLYKNIPVYGSHITAAEDKETGKPTEELTGIIIKDIETDVKSKTPKITKNDALKIAKTFHGYGDKKTSRHSFKLTIYHKDGKAHLAFIVKFVAFNKNITRPATIVDAMNKEVIDSWETVKTATKSLAGYGGNTYIGKNKFTGKSGEFEKLTLTVHKDNSSRCLMENEYFRVIDMINLQFESDEVVEEIMEGSHIIPTIEVNCNTDPIPDKKTISDAYDVRTDAYYFAYQTIKMYEKFDFSVYDEKMEIWVNFGEKKGGNAVAFEKFLLFNNGGDEFYPLASYADVVAHEMGHTFTDINSELEYRYQSGGMNEAFSDISGKSLERFLKIDNGWILGKKALRDKEKAGVRFMDNPQNDGESIAHADHYNDELDVHLTSGVYNKAFYLLVSTEGWDYEKAFEIFAMANKFYWGETTTFNEGACGVLSAASDKGFSGDDVTKAFKGVGVQCNDKTKVEVVD